MTLKQIKKEIEEWSGFTITEEESKTKESLINAIESIKERMEAEAFQKCKVFRLEAQKLNIPEC